VNKSVLIAGAGIVFLGGYYLANNRAEEILVVTDGALDIELQASEIIESEESRDNLLSARLNDLNGLQSSLNAIDSEYILVNFWATWCKPCVEEMPMLQSLQIELGGNRFSVAGLAIDAADSAARMVEELKITYPIFVADLEGPELMAKNGNEQGLLPYTVLLSSSGEVISSKLGTVQEQDIRGWLNLAYAASDN
jgi:thiol-disulfide isomerase/thioredoxin